MHEVQERNSANFIKSPPFLNNKSNRTNNSVICLKCQLNSDNIHNVNTLELMLDEILENLNLEQ